MHLRSLIAVVYSLAFITVAAAREPIKLETSTGIMRLELQEGKLLVSNGGGTAISVSDGFKEVTNFAVAEWDGGKGLALAIETSGFKQSRSYFWMTMWVGDEKTGASRLDAGKLGFGIVGKGTIFENVEPLSILGLSTHGDGLLVTLYDQSGVPGSDRKLAFQFQHDCAITSQPNLGRSHRLYLTPTAVKALSGKTDRQVWLSEAPNTPRALLQD